MKAARTNKYQHAHGCGCRYQHQHAHGCGCRYEYQHAHGCGCMYEYELEYVNENGMRPSFSMSRMVMSMSMSIGCNNFNPSMPAMSDTHLQVVYALEKALVGAY